MNTESVELGKLWTNAQTNPGKYDVPGMFQFLTPAYPDARITVIPDPEKPDQPARIGLKGELSAQVEAYVQKLNASRRKPIRRELIYSLISVGGNPNMLTAEAAVTDYGAYRWAVSLAPDEWLDLPQKPTHLAAAALITTHDGKHLVLAKRNPDLVHRPGALEVPGGGVESQDLTKENYFNLTDSAIREAKEELDIPPDHLKSKGRTYLIAEQYGDRSVTAGVNLQATPAFDPRALTITDEAKPLVISNAPSVIGRELISNASNTTSVAQALLVDHLGSQFSNEQVGSSEEPVVQYVVACLKAVYDAIQGKASPEEIATLQATLSSPFRTNI